jgi:bacillolysin
MRHPQVIHATAAAGVLALVLLLVLGGTSQEIRGQQRPAGVGSVIQSRVEPDEGLVVTQLSRNGGAAAFAATAGRGIRLSVPPSSSRSERALAFVDRYGTAFGLGGRDEVRVTRETAADDVVGEHVRLQQVHRGIPVRAGEFLVHLKGGRVVAANGHVTDRFPEDLTPSVTPAAALESARAYIAKNLRGQAADATYSEPRLEIFDRGLVDEGVYPVVLTWFVEARGPELRQYVWVDAQRGGVVFGVSQLARALSRAVYTANNGSVLPGTLVRSEGGPATGDADVDDAYRFTGATYDYFFTVHGQDSYDNAGATIVSSVHYLSGFAGLMWNGSQIVYGDGYASADDMVAHELAHAVADHTADFLDYNQSGALNESFADIFGETVDLVDGFGNDLARVRWQIGEDLPSGAVRDMMSPNAYGQPARMTDSTYFSCSDHAWTDGNADGGGIHVNSGVPNHAYALMVDGGTYNGYTITGIGLTKAAKVEYRALREYLASGSGFDDAYAALNQACGDLVGTAGITMSDCTQVQSALQAVEMDHPFGCSAYVATPAFCPTGSAVTSFYDGFETDSGSWTATSTSQNNWVRQPAVARTDEYAVFGTDGVPGVYDGVSDHSYAMTTSAVVPSNGRLYFDQLFEFESGDTANWDAGVLEYTTNGGTTWQDAGGLIEAGRGYNGTVSASANPLSGRSAFVRSSFGYTGTRLNLSSLAGQSVRFRFRIGTDVNGSSLGWAVDDFRIYTCQTTPPPAAFNKSSPANGATEQPTTVTLTWTASAGATSYDVCVGMTSAWDCSILGASVAGTSRQVTGLPVGTVLYWHVRANNAGGTTYSNGSSGASWSFTTASPPGAFNKVGPTNGATVQLASVTFSWSASSGATSYDLCIDITNSNPCRSGWLSVGTATSYTAYGFHSGLTYYWHMRANGPGGTTYANGSATAFWAFTAAAGLHADFDGDRKADVAVYRPLTGTWFWLESSVNRATMNYRGWGIQAQGDVPVIGDFDGDGKMDPCVFRPASGTWFFLRSEANYTTWGWLGWGTSTDTLMPADYDGDGRTDAAVYRPSNATWYVRPSSVAAQWNVVFGAAGDIPLAGDFDGDGRADLAVYRPVAGTWFVLHSSNNYSVLWYRGWGVQAQGDVPVPGDYDGDGKTDLCVFRPASGTWFILESHAGFSTWSWFGWGASTDTLVPADYDGDGKTDGAIYQPGSGTWFVRPSSGATAWSVVFGQAGDVPLLKVR